MGKKPRHYITVKQGNSEFLIPVVKESGESENKGVIKIDCPNGMRIVVKS